MNRNTSVNCGYIEHVSNVKSNTTVIFNDYQDELKCFDEYKTIATATASSALVVGGIGNTLSALLLHRLSRSSENVMPLLLKVLAFVDNFFLFVYAAYCWNYTMINYHRPINFWILKCLTITLYWLSRFFTIYMAVLIGLMRYIAVCKPFSAARICTKRNAWIAMGTGLILNTVIHTPMLGVWVLG